MKRNSLFLLLLSGLCVIAWWTFSQADTGHLALEEGTQFAINDTARVSRIRIADAEGRVALLERQNQHPLGLWQLNGHLLARKDATDLLLKTFKRVSVRQPVRSTAKEGVLKMMATAGKRVDIHIDGQATPHKTWFVGTPTQSHTGTHMLLELPDGRSQQPYVTHMEGFTGFLSTRFFTDETEWRYTGIFESDAQSISTITATPWDDVGMSATLRWDSTGERIAAIHDGKVLELPQTMLREQWLKFRKVHVETWNSHLTQLEQDSLKASEKAWSIVVEYVNGERRGLDLHWKAPIIEEYDADGRLMTHDGSRMYAVYEGECALIQTFVFNPLLDLWRSLPELTNPNTNP